MLSTAKPESGAGRRANDRAKGSKIMDRATDIEIRAYLIWERAGCPDGHALDHWLEAEAESAAEPDTQDPPAGAKADETPSAKRAQKRSFQASMPAA